MSKLIFLYFITVYRKENIHFNYIETKVNRNFRVNEIMPWNINEERYDYFKLDFASSLFVNKINHILDEQK